MVYNKIVQKVRWFWKWSLETLLGQQHERGKNLLLGACWQEKGVKKKATYCESWEKVSWHQTLISDLAIPLIN